MLLYSKLPPEDPRPFGFSGIGRGLQKFQEILGSLYIHTYMCSGNVIACVSENSCAPTCMRQDSW